MKFGLLLLFCGVSWTQLNTEIMRAATTAPDYQESKMRAQKIRQMELQNQLTEQAIHANALKLQQEQAAFKDQLKKPTETADSARTKALEERLDKLESVFARFIDMETDRWKTTNESLDLLAKPELEKLKTK